MSSSKKGYSAHQLHRTLGITYQSAWFLAHSIREAMKDMAPTPMGGEGKVIEADENITANAKHLAKIALAQSHPKKAARLAVLTSVSSLAW
jgi:hypothetical protein